MALIRRLRLNSLVLAVLAPAIAMSTAGFGYAAYVRFYATILEGFDRKLAALSSAMSVYMDADAILSLLAEKTAIQARGQNPEEHPTYVKFVRPMRQLRERAGLTFLYTQMLKPGPDRQCVYLIDGTVGEGHSELGETDTVPADDWDVALRVTHDGAVAQTAIRQWEQWGLLKCGWAPIYGQDGQIKAMAGADVEITVIRKKTYVALLETLGVGALAMLLAGAVSVRVARRLTQPLGEVREASLRIASGDYRARCHVEHPTEIRALSGALNDLALMMETTIDDARPRMREWRRQRAANALVERLTPTPYRSRDLAIVVGSGTDASGYVVHGHVALAWLGTPQADRLSARKVARDIEEVARRLLAQDGPAALERIAATIGMRARALALIDFSDWSVRLRGSELRAFVLPSAGSRHTAPNGIRHAIAIGETVLVAVAESEPFASADAAPLALTTFVAAAGGHVRGIVAAVHRPAHDEPGPDSRDRTLRPDREHARSGLDR
jgi:HAMP domain-containing protein